MPNTEIGETLDKILDTHIQEFVDKFRLQQYRNMIYRAFKKRMPVDVYRAKHGKMLYLVEGPEDYELLDWDATMLEQPEQVLEKLKRAGLFYSDNDTGERLYKRLSRDLGGGGAEGDRLASMALNDAGIPGHRYWDAGSRTKKAGTHNFVIWNMDTLRLLGLTEDSDEDAQEYYRAEDYNKAYLDSLDNDSNFVDYSSRDYERGIDDYARASLDAREDDGFSEVYHQPDSLSIPEQQIEAVRRKYQGTRERMKAPNGKPTKLTERQWLQVRTPNFIRWFGDWLNDPEHSSKVLDENGEPLVVYHGTLSGKFSIFNTQGRGRTKGTGSWFTSSRQNVEHNSTSIVDVKKLALSNLHYAKSMIESLARDGYTSVEKINEGAVNGRLGKDEAQYIAGRFLRAQKLMDLQSEILHIINILEDTNIDASIDSEIHISNYAGYSRDRLDEAKALINGLISNEMTARANYRIYEVFLNIRSPYRYDAHGNDWTELHGNNDHYSTDKLVLEVKAGRLGGVSDGVIIQNVIDGAKIDNKKVATNDYIVYNPEQIKSATDNNGDFDPNDPDHYHQLIGKDGAEALDNYEGVTTRMDALKQAEEMDIAGAPVFAIWRNTRWMRGHDGKWRTEITDGSFKKDLAIRAAKEWGLVKATSTLGEVLDYPALFTAYPELKRYKITFINDEQPDGNPFDYMGFKEHKLNGKAIPAGQFNHGTKEIEIIGNFDFNGTYLRPEANQNAILAVLHEVQHAIQGIEGWPKGTNLDAVIDSIPEVQELRGKLDELKNQRANLIRGLSNQEHQHSIDELNAEIKATENKLSSLMTSAIDDGTAMSLYIRDTGETEARNVMTRYGMTEKERRDTPLSATEDIPRREQTDIYHQIIGERGARRLDEFEGFTKRMDALKQAKEMKAAGMPVSSIWRNTGWMEGADGLWRMEIPYGKLSELLYSEDFLNDAKKQKDAEGQGLVKFIMKNNRPYRPITLPDIYSNEALYTAYPEFEYIIVKFRVLPKGTQARYLFRDGDIDISIELLNKKDYASIYTNLVHEIQHAVQQREGFDTGERINEDTVNKYMNIAVDLVLNEKGDTKEKLRQAFLAMFRYADDHKKTDKEQADAIVMSMSEYELSVWNKIMNAYQLAQNELGRYKASVGEVEARNAQVRAAMIKLDRMLTPLSATEDYKRSEQIISSPIPEFDPFDFEIVGEEYDATKVKREQKSSSKPLEQHDPAYTYWDNKLKELDTAAGISDVISSIDEEFEMGLILQYEAEERKTEVRFGTSYAEEYRKIQAHIDDIRNNPNTLGNNREQYHQIIGEKGTFANLYDNPLVERYSQLHTFGDTDTEKKYSGSLSDSGSKSEILQSLKDIMHGFKGDFPELAGNSKFTPAREILRMMGRKSDAKVLMAVKGLVQSVEGLNANQLNIFGRFMLLNDIETFRMQNPNAALPMGFTLQSFLAERSRFTELANNDDAIMKALRSEQSLHEQINNALAKYAEKLGLPALADKVRHNDFYILEYSKMLKGEDINANYLKAVADTRAQQLRDIEHMAALLKLRAGYDIKRKLIEKFGGDWRRHIPKGYSTFSPLTGHFIMSAHTLTENVLGAGLEQLGETLGLSAQTMEALRSSVADNSGSHIMVLPDALTDTLEALATPKVRGDFGKIAKTLTTQWKKWMLFFPTRAFKYNVRNITGDLDAVIAGNPHALVYLPQAFKELCELYYGSGKPSNELFEFQKRGGAITIQSTQELGDYKELKEFTKLMEELQGKDASAWTKLPRKVWKLIDKLAWSGIQNFSDFREQWLRYACYLDYLNQMQNNEEHMPKNWGASVREEVLSIPAKSDSGVRDRAFKMSNELLGAYDQVSRTGKAMRDIFWPFYSWVEVNAKRYYRLIKNGITEDGLGDFATRFLKGQLLNVPYYGFKLAKTYLMINLLSMLIAAFNNLVWPDDEDKLPPDVQSRPHITLGHDTNGNVLYFDRVGAMLDNLEWFGQESSPFVPFAQDVRDILDGRQTVTGFISKLITSPINKVVSGINPIFKTPLELLAGKSLYPDFTNPRNIRDRTQYIAQSFGLNWPYKAATGQPVDNWKEFKNLFVYQADAEEAAYFYTLGLVRQFEESVLGKRTGGFGVSKRGQVLQKLRTAMRLGLRDDVQRYLQEYYKLGGNQKGLKASMRNMNPLHGLSKDEQAKFLKWITPEERKYLNRANAFFKKMTSSFLR